MTDQEIINTIQSGDRNAINLALRVVYKQNYETVKTLVLKTKGNTQDAADVFQNAMMVVYQQIRDQKFLGKSSLKTYIYAISRNIWFKMLKERSQELNVENLDPGLSAISSQEVEEIVITYEKKLTFPQLLEQLGESCKEVLKDFYYNGMNLQEIATKYNLASDATAKNKKYRCMVKLMNLIKERDIKMQDLDLDSN